MSMNLPPLIKEYYSSNLMTTYSKVGNLEIIKPVPSLTHDLFVLCVNQYVAENEYHAKPESLDGLYCLAYYPNDDGLICTPMDNNDLHKNDLVGVARVNFVRSTRYALDDMPIDEWISKKDYINSVRQSLRAFNPKPVDMEEVRNQKPMKLANGKSIQPL